MSSLLNNLPKPPNQSFPYQIHALFRTPLQPPVGRMSRWEQTLLTGRTLRRWRQRTPAGLYVPPPVLRHLVARDVNATKLEWGNLDWYSNDYRYQPYDEREFEWLEAFMRAVRFTETLGRRGGGSESRYGLGKASDRTCF